MADEIRFITPIYETATERIQRIADGTPAPIFMAVIGHPERGQQITAIQALEWANGIETLASLLEGISHQLADAQAAVAHCYPAEAAAALYDAQESLRSASHCMASGLRRKEFAALAAAEAAG